MVSSIPDNSIHPGRAQSWQGGANAMAARSGFGGACFGSGGAADYASVPSALNTAWRNHPSMRGGGLSPSVIKNRACSRQAGAGQRARAASRLAAAPDAGPGRAACGGRTHLAAARTKLPERVAFSVFHFTTAGKGDNIHSFLWLKPGISKHRREKWKNHPPNPRSRRTIPRTQPRCRPRPSRRQNRPHCRPKGPVRTRPSFEPYRTSTRRRPPPSPSPRNRSLPTSYPRLRDPGRTGPRRHGRRLQGPAREAEPRWWP